MLAFPRRAREEERMDKPAVFQAIGFAEALQQSTRDGKWLLVDATATWCAPCRQMDKTTWRDATVLGWVERHGLAIQVDVDAEEQVARTLEIRAMPTVVAFK